VTVRGHGFTDPTATGCDRGAEHFTVHVRVASDGTVSGTLTARFDSLGETRVVARAECAIVIGGMAVVAGPGVAAGKGWLVFALSADAQLIQIYPPVGGPFPGDDACIDVATNTRDFVPLVRGKIVISGA
jgi:hypothetical protein